MILVSGCFVLTPVNWSWNGSPIWKLTKANMQPRSVVWLWLTGKQQAPYVVRRLTYTHFMWCTCKKLPLNPMTMKMHGFLSVFPSSMLMRNCTGALWATGAPLIFSMKKNTNDWKISFDVFFFLPQKRNFSKFRFLNYVFRCGSSANASHERVFM